MAMFPSWQWWCFHRDNDDVSIVTMMMFPGQLCCFQDVTRSWAEIRAAHWLLREGSNCHTLGQNFSRNLDIIILIFLNFKFILIICYFDDFLKGAAYWLWRDPAQILTRTKSNYAILIISWFWSNYFLIGTAQWLEREPSNCHHLDKFFPRIPTF